MLSGTIPQSQSQVALVQANRRTIMKMLMSLGIAVTFLLFGNTEASAAGCDAVGNVRFICDQLDRKSVV